MAHVVIEAYDRHTGRIDSQRFAKVLALTTQEIAKILDRTPRGIAKNPSIAKASKWYGKTDEFVSNLFWRFLMVLFPMFVFG